MKAARLVVGLLIVLVIARAGLGVANGLSADYFANARFAGSPAVTRIDSDVSTRRLNAAWAGQPPATFSVRWQGYLTIAAEGSYVFGTRSDDGSRLTIGDSLIVDNGGRHVPLTRSGEVTLGAGAHRVIVEYQQAGGGYDMALLWGRGQRALAPVPSWMLSPQRVPVWKLQAARALDWILFVAGWAMLAWALWWTLRSWRAAVTAVLGRPRMASLVLFIVLAVIQTWPLGRYPGRLSRNDNNDTVFNEWVLAWVAHQAPRAPLRLYDANIYHPERDTLAYSESMIVQSAMGAPLRWLGASPVLTYNLVLLAGLALTGWSMCLVMVRWTGEWAAGLLSGVLAAFNAYTLTSLPHLQNLHVEFLPPALLALDALLREPRVRHALRLAMWFTLQALTSVHLLIFSAFALTAGALVRPAAWRGARFTRTAAFAALAAAVAAIALLPFLLPYWRVYHDQGLSRTIDSQATLAATWRDYVTTPGRFHYELWSHRVMGRAGLFPGVIGLALTGLALARRVAFSDPRARMCLAFGIGGLILSFGPAVPGYALLYEWLLPLHAIRVISRFGYLALFAVACLAGFGLLELRRLIPARRWPVAAIVILLAGALEPLAAPLTLVRFDRISPIYSRLAAEPGAVVVELPFYGGSSAHAHAPYMLNSTAHWKPILNGHSGASPPSFVDHVRTLRGFPDPASIAALQRAGVTHVFVHRNGFPPHIAELAAEVAALRRLEEIDGIILYRLDGPPAASWR